MKNQRTVKEIEARIDIAINDFDPTAKSNKIREEALKKEASSFITTHLNNYNKKKKLKHRKKEEKPPIRANKLRSTTRLLVKRKSTIKVMDSNLKLDFKKNIRTPNKPATRKNSAENHSQHKDKVETKLNGTPNKFNNEENSKIL
jgi:hypothetical protein